MLAPEPGSPLAIPEPAPERPVEWGTVNQPVNADGWSVADRMVSNGAAVAWAGA